MCTHKRGNTYVKVLISIISGITDGGKTVGRVALTEEDNEFWTYYIQDAYYIPQVDMLPRVKREILISNRNLGTVNVQMEFKGKRSHEITKKVAFNPQKKKKNGTKDRVLQYPTFRLKKMMTNQQTRQGRKASWVERQPEECATCRSREWPPLSKNAASHIQGELRTDQDTGTSESQSWF